MSDLGKLFFGGSKASSKPVDLTPEAFAGLQGPLAQVLQGLIGGTPGNALGGLPQPPSLPAEATSITDNERRLLQSLAGLGGGQGGDMIARTLAGEFMPGQPGGNQFLDAAIEAAQRPTRLALEDTLSRTLPGVFTAAGHRVGGGLRSPNATLRPQSTAFDLAAARAFEGGSRALGDIATNISSGAYGLERNAQLQAIQLGQSEVQTLVKNLEAQALPRLIATIGPQQAIAQFNEQVKALLQALAMATQAASPTIGNVQKSSSDKGVVPALLPKGLQSG